MRGSISLSQWDHLKNPCFADHLENNMSFFHCKWLESVYVCCFYLFYPIYKFLNNHWLTSVLFKYWPRKFLMPVRLQLVNYSVQFSSVAQSYPTLRPCELQHARPPCLSPTPRVYSDSCPLSWWCHPAISSSVIPFSSCPQSLPASESFPMNQLFAWGDQSIGVSASASVLPMNTQDWFPLGWTGWISLQSNGLSRVFSNTTVQRHQSFGTQNCTRD